MKFLHRIVIACLLALPFISYVLNSAHDTPVPPDMMLRVNNRYKQRAHLIKNSVPQNIPANASFFFDTNGTLFFIGSDGSKEGLWTSDGTAKGTIFVRNIDSDIDSSLPDNFIKRNNPLFFSANNKPVHP